MIVPISGFWFVIGLLAGVGFSAAAIALFRPRYVGRRLVDLAPETPHRLFMYRGEPDAQIRERIAAARSN